MQIKLGCLAVVVGVALSVSPAAFTQTARSGGSAANAQAMAQLQQLAAERTQLQAENARIKGDLEQARKERDSLKSAQELLGRRSRGAEAELATVLGDKARLEGDLAREKQRVEELVQRFRETATSVREVEADRATKTQQLAQREQELKVCVDRNRNLYALSTEVIAKLEDQGFWSAIARQEPFTKLKRVELENLADGYRQTADEQRVVPASPRATK